MKKVRRVLAVLMAAVILLGVTAVIVSAEDAQADKFPYGLADIPQILKTAFPQLSNVIEFFSPVLRVPMFVYGLFEFLGCVLLDVFM